MKVADLFALLKIKVDQATIDKAESHLDRMNSKVAKFAKSVNDKLGTALNAVGIAGAVGFVAAAKDAFKFDTALNRLAIGSRGAMGTFEDMRDQILAISTATGVAKEDLLEGAQAFVAATGDGKAAAASMGTFARVSKAAGVPMKDVADVAASLFQQLKIAPEDFEKTFSTLIAGGKAGAVEFADMAALMSEVAAKGSEFANVFGQRGAAEIAAAFQIVKQGFGGPQGANKAATALTSLMGELGGKAKGLRKYGVRVFETDASGKKIKRNLGDIVKEVAKIDIETLEKLFGKESAAALTQLNKVPGAWDDLTQATLNANDVSEDYAANSKIGGEQVAVAWNKAKNQITQAFNPKVIRQLADALTSIIGAVSRFVDAVGGAKNAMWLLIGAWGVLKGMQLAGFITSIITKLGGLATASAAAGGALSGTLGLGARLGLLGAAAGVGVAAGMWADKEFGISDKWAGVGDYRDPYAQATRKRLMLDPEYQKRNAGRKAYNPKTKSMVIVNVSGAGNPAAVAREIEYRAASSATGGE